MTAKEDESRADGITNHAKWFGNRVRAAGWDGPRWRAADGIIVDGDFLVVSDSANYKVRRIERFGKHRITTLVGDGRAGTDLGTGATAHLVNPRGLALTPSGYVVADSGNDRIVRIQP